MKTIQRSTRWLRLALACGIITFAARVPAQRPVILSFESNGLLTWSNAYPDAIASIERLSDVVTTGAVVKVTETLGISDGSTVIYNCTVEHPPVVNPSVTISDGTFSWSDQMGSSSPANFLGAVTSYESGQVSAIYLSTPSTVGTVIQVEYSYLPVSTNQEWRTVYSAPATSQVMQVTVDMNEESGLFRVANSPSLMVLIPGGSNNGTNPLDASHCDGDYNDCYSPETYSLSVDSFYMDRYLVTKALWDQVANWASSHGYDLTAGGGSGKAPDHPVYDVTWYECVKWCNARSEMESRSPAYYTSAARTTAYRTGSVDVQDDWVLWDAGYRLPTSEEWEYAARGGLVSKRFPWGDTISHSQANYYAGIACPFDLSTGGFHPLYHTGDPPYTSPVNAFAPNAYGLHDMAGNLGDWCFDMHPCAGGRIRRGGSYVNWESALSCRLGVRGGRSPSESSDNTGFRAVLPISQ